MNSRLTTIVRVFMPILASALIPAVSCFAWYGPNCCFVDGHTRYMWARTWHGPNDLAMPLNQYFVPRTPGYCSSEGYGGRAVGCQSGVAGQYGALPYSANAAAGFEPVQFERLGRVPNELDVLGGAAAPAGGAAPAPRR